MDRGISDVLGYVLVFSLILGSITIVYVGGFNSLTHLRDAERIDNAERAFDVLDTNVDDLVLDDAPSRATELTLARSSLTFGDPVAISVDIAGTTYRTQIDPIVFTAGDGNKLVYANGAIIRVDGSESVMIDTPPFLFGDRTLIPIVDTRSIGSGVGGSGRVLIRTTVAQRTLTNVSGAGPYDYTLNVTTSNTDAWEEYLEGRMGDANSCSVIGDTVTCTGRADSVYIKKTAIDVRFL
ncbi:MAG: hypothetical protein ABEJ58_07750 [Halodesulfurarchaeum sp.]